MPSRGFVRQRMEWFCVSPPLHLHGLNLWRFLSALLRLLLCLLDSVGDFFSVRPVHRLNENVASNLHQLRVHFERPPSSIPLPLVAVWCMTARHQPARRVARSQVVLENASARRIKVFLVDLHHARGAVKIQHTNNTRGVVDTRDQVNQNTTSKADRPGQVVLKMESRYIAFFLTRENCPA